MFGGVNHHLNSILFDAGFISSDIKDSFVWLFTQFLNCMDTLPKIIITDQDYSIEVGLLIVFPQIFIIFASGI